MSSICVFDVVRFLRDRAKLKIALTVFCWEHGTNSYTTSKTALSIGSAYRYIRQHRQSASSRLIRASSVRRLGSLRR